MPELSRSPRVLLVAVWLAGWMASGCGGRRGSGASNSPPTADAAADMRVPQADAAVEVQLAHADGGLDSGDTGSDLAGDLAIEAPADTIPTPEPPPSVKSLHAGYNVTCALFVSGRFKCWGGNGSGQLGLGEKLPRGKQPGTMGAALPYVDVGTNSKVASLALGAVHACALLDDGRVKCWGDNTDGQLGTGRYGDQVGDDRDEMGDRLPAIDFGPDRRALAITAGPRHTCAMLDGGEIRCWGRNDWGNLGLGDASWPWPHVPGPTWPVLDLGNNRHAVAVSAGGAFGSPYTRDVFHTSAFSCALLDDGAVKCWGGHNAYGAIGDDRIDVRGDKAGQMGDEMPALKFGGRRARTIAMGAGHGCALLDDDLVRCWGNNHQNQVGAPSSGPPDDPHVAVNLGPGRTARAIAVSVVTTFIDEAHSCAVLDDGRATCWGANWHGQLGLPQCPNFSGGLPCRERLGPLPAIDLGSGRRVQTLAAGGRHTCALLDDGRVKCWGNNDAGQLGLEDTRPRGMDAGEMGDRLPAVALW